MVLGDRGRVGLPLISVVVPYFGSRRCVSRYIRDTLLRSCDGVRVVMIGSNSASGSIGVLGGLGNVGLCARGGSNTYITEGFKLCGDGNGCVGFLSSSSFLRPKVIGGRISLTRRLSSGGVVCNSCCLCEGYGGDCRSMCLRGSRRATTLILNSVLASAPLREE